MKFSKHYTVLDETVIEVETDFPTTVDRLRSMQGVCRETDNDQFPLGFTCDKKGRLRVDALYRSTSSNCRLNFVVGEVAEQDGKTVAKIYCVHDRSAKVYRYVEWAVYAALFCAFLVFVAYSIKAGRPLSRKDVITVVLFALLLFTIPFRTKKDAQNQPADLEKMKTEVINRVRAVDRWDD